jgi:DNA-binding beta-propeller fold protein YncE
MKRSNTKICLVAVFSLLLSVIWQNPAGAATAPTIAPLGQIRDGLSTPSKIAVDAQGALYVADVTKKAVVKYSKHGEQLRQYTGLAFSGIGLAVTPDGGVLYVADRHAVSRVDGATGAVLGLLGQGAGEFAEVSDLALDAAGFVFVADAGNKKVRVYDPAGLFRYEFGGAGTAAGQFGGMTALAVDQVNASVYVADQSLGKVEVFTLGGEYLRTLSGATNFGTKTIKDFTGMTFDDAGRLYVFDFMNSFMVVDDLAGGNLSIFANGGFGNGQLQSPLDALYDPATGRLFVSCGDGRVEIFGIDGSTNPAPPVPNSAPGVPSLIAPTSGQELASATPQLQLGNAVDADNDPLTYDVMILDGAGALVVESLAQAEGAGSTQVAVNESLADNLYSWKARACDALACSEWTSAVSFYVNAVNEAPAAPVLASPLLGETLDADGLLSWGAAADSDPFDQISYRLEVTDEFGSEVAVQTLSGTEVALGELADYLSLEDGGTYFWKVAAVDDKGLATVSEPGNFVFDTTLLRVTANMPGARVYLGGNHGYAGRFLGETPLELRTFPEGTSSLVIERSGFEPFVAQVQLAYQDNATVQADLLPAMTPADFKGQTLKQGNTPIRVSSKGAPCYVDFNNDGQSDLLVVDTACRLLLYTGVVGGASPLVLDNVVLEGLAPGAVPFVADWNNDGKKDLVIGFSDGSLRLYLNEGSESAPFFGEGAYLQVAGTNLAVCGDAVPVVADFNDDGKKDLLVGSSAGEVALYLNVAEDAAPAFAAVQGLVAGLSGAVAPMFIDWDADGKRDLLLAADGRLFVAEPQVDGSYLPVPVLVVGAVQGTDTVKGDRKGSKGQGRTTSAGPVVSSLRIAAVDVDDTAGKDLIVCDESGEIRLFCSAGKECLPAFGTALLDKVAQVGELIGDDLALQGQLSAVKSRVASGKYAAAADLAARMNCTGDALAAANELVALLK